MADLINRKAANEALEKLSDLLKRRAETKDHGFLAIQAGVTLAQAEIEAVPSVDAAPVVRCKDCENATMTTDGMMKYCKFWPQEDGEALYLPGDFFCGAGERMDADRVDANGDAKERREGIGQ